MDVWGEEASPLKKWSSYFPDFNLLWEDLTNRLETHLVDQVAAIFYKIWARRNSFVFHNKFLSPLVLIQTAIDDIEVYKELHLKVPSSIENISLQNSVVQWRPPCDPFFKLNFDAAFDSEKRMMGIGIVVRDSRSKLCQELGMQQVIFEGDAKVVIDGVNGIKSNCSWQGQLLDDMKFLLLRHTDWKLHFVKRNGNKAAHSAAKIGMYLENEVVWIEDGPSEVLSAIFFDKQCIPILS
ncbi:uncharacterized protein LOC122289303 [Carya illinoinensis]|uniref:uncharacterized protein LOC122289303 n=1 Tax=Carya illinoinensis TaxID=32201 RepID=UPI001C7246AF|nr:uncharacterized protein LOC122289303 [Carya illinoinensis]